MRRICLVVILPVMMLTGASWLPAQTAAPHSTIHEPAVALSALPAPVDDDHDGIDDGLEQELAEMHAPVLFIEHDESNYPVNVEWFLARAHLQYHEDCLFDTDDNVGSNPIVTQQKLLGPNANALWAGGPNCGEDDINYGHPPHRQLTTIAADPDGQYSVGALTTGYSDQQTFLTPDLADSDRVGSTDPRDWRTYYHVYPGANGGVMIQYWHLFAYNELSVLGIGNHGGDWDASIQVQLAADFRIEGIWFSRHDDDKPGHFIAAGNPRLHLLAGTRHPLMAIDGGGHAAFADPDDFCDNHASVAGGQIAWPFGLHDPTNPATLSTFATKLGGCEISDDPAGGIVWETWTGGSVLTSGGLTHPITAPSPHGGLVNLGEYNPCTPSACFGTAQASSLLSGEFHPLNGQTFIRYSGKWGSLPHIQGIAGNPPRGPVFQGFDDRGEGHVSVYTAWYNKGSDNPADAGNSPWRVPPITMISAEGPFASIGTQFYITSATQLDLTPSQNSVASGFGASRSFIRSRLIGQAPPPFSPFTGPISLSGPDGIYLVDYFSIDALNNVESMQSALYNLDNTAPAVVCPANITTDTINAGDATVAVNYPAPGASDNVAVRSVICTPPSGSLFPPGVTAVNCTATDEVNNAANCSFSVDIFDYVIVDEARGNILRFNSGTGDYDFFACSKGIVASGRGTVTTNSCKTQLQAGGTGKGASLTVSVLANYCTKVGDATVIVEGVIYSLHDANMSDNVVKCH